MNTNHLSYGLKAMWRSLNLGGVALANGGPVRPPMGGYLHPLKHPLTFVLAARDGATQCVYRRGTVKQRDVNGAKWM
jgi:hypothetical protein